MFTYASPFKARDRNIEFYIASWRDRSLIDDRFVSHKISIQIKYFRLIVGVLIFINEYNNNNKKKIFRTKEKEKIKPENLKKYYYWIRIFLAEIRRHYYQCFNPIWNIFVYIHSINLVLLNIPD